MKKFLFVGVCLILAYSTYSFLTLDRSKKASKALKITTEPTNKRINDQVKIIKEYLRKNPDYNSKILFLADMKIPSGRNRFFIYDLSRKEVVDQGLVAHGSGSETGIENELKFSNVNNSLATSLGKYSIGESYEGKFGKAYKLYGLEASNSNAFSRSIVLHKYSKMPYEEQINPVCNSLGCPMVNEIYFNRIEKILDTSDKRILLDIYY